MVRLKSYILLLNYSVNYVNSIRMVNDAYKLRNTIENIY